MSKSPNQLAEQFVEVAEQFFACEPWKQIPSVAIFLVRVPSDELPLVASIMGDDGEQFGLMMTRGERAFQIFADLVLERIEIDDFSEACNSLSVGFHKWSAVPKEWRGFTEEAGLKPKAKDIVPVAFASAPYEAHRPADLDGVRSLIWAMRAIIAAIDAGELEPFVIDEDCRLILELSIDGDPQQPEVRASTVDWPATSIDVPPLTVLPSDLADLARRDERWIVLRTELPVMLEGDARMVSGFLIAVEGGSVFGSDVGLGDDLTMGEMLVVQALRGKCDASEHDGLPREIIFADRRLHDALAPALAGLDITTSYDPEHPSVIAVEEEFEGNMERWDEAIEQAPRGALQDCSHEVTGILGDELDQRGLVTPQAIELYFGSIEEGDAVMKDPRFRRAYPAFMEWLVMHYRPDEGGKSLAQEFLAKGDLQPELQRVLEARLKAPYSIYRFCTVKPGEVLELEDVLTGEHHTIPDEHLIRQEFEGFCAPLRLVRVEEWTFASPEGPLLAGEQLAETLEFLEGAGVELTHEGLLRKAHLLGRLWTRALQQDPPKP